MAAIIATALSSCAAMPIQALQVGTAYKYDMLLSVNGHTGTGMLVVPKADPYAFDITAQGDLDLFTLESCHREQDTENAFKQVFLAKNHREYAFTYAPSPTIETEGACPVRLAGYTEKNGQSSWGFVDFEDPETTLPALVQCDGETPYESNGVSVCQSKVGTLQKITFPVRVMVFPDAGCNMPTPADNRSFFYTISKGFCVYSFVEIAPKDKQHRHRLSTYGFEQIILHGKN